MCSRINMQIPCTECDYAYRDCVMDTEYSVFQILPPGREIMGPCEVCPVIQHLNEILPDSLGG